MIRTVIYFLAATVFCTGGWNIFPRLLNVHEFGEVRQTNTHTDEWLGPENDSFGIEMAFDSLITL